MAQFTLNTDPKFDETLTELVKLTGGTKADVLLKAVATYKYLKTENQNPAKKISITENGVVPKDVTLP